MKLKEPLALVRSRFSRQSSKVEGSETQVGTKENTDIATLLGTQIDVITANPIREYLEQLKQVPHGHRLVVTKVYTAQRPDLRQTKLVDQALEGYLESKGLIVSESLNKANVPSETNSRVERFSSEDALVRIEDLNKIATGGEAGSYQGEGERILVYIDDFIVTGNDIHSQEKIEAQGQEGALVPVTPDSKVVALRRVIAVVEAGTTLSDALSTVRQRSLPLPPERRN